MSRDPHNDMPKETALYNAATLHAQEDQTTPPQSHDPEVILQGLERWIAYQQGTTTVYFYYSIENYRGTEEAWDDVPVVFTNGPHPDMEKMKTDAEEAIEEVNGRYAADIYNTKVIESPGQPRMTAKIHFTDPETRALYEAGKLGVSTAVETKIAPDARLVGKVVPNHVLVFPTSNEYQPRDGGAMLLNNIIVEEEDDSMKELDRLTTEIRELKNSVAAAINGTPQTNTPPTDPPQANTPPTDPPSNGENNMDTDTQQLLQNKEAELQAKEAKIKDLEDQKTKAEQDLEEYRKAESDRKWNELKNNTIPEGLVQKTEDEKELRQLYNSDKDAFYSKVLAVTRKAPNGGEEGAMFTNSEDFGKQKSTYEEWDKATGAEINV